jgi:hypothetical protein
MSAHVHMTVRCDEQDCRASVEVTGKIVATLGSSGCIDVDLHPDVPPNWSWYYGWRCPEHDGRKR